METKGKTKVGVIYRELRERIILGQYKPGKMLPTQQQLSRDFEVSENTASAAMGRLVHEGLVVRTAGVGSVVNPEARFPVTLGTIHFVRERRVNGNRVGALGLIEDLSQVCEQKHYAPMWHHMTFEEMEDPKSLLSRFRGARGVVAVQGVPTALPRFLSRQGLRVVAVLPRPDESDGDMMLYPQVTFDRCASVSKAVVHLVSLGYRRIAYAGRAGSAVRTVAFMEAVQKHGLAGSWDWIKESKQDYMGDLSGWLKKLLHGQDGPEAICCATEHAGLYVEQMLLEMGCRVPQDVAIIACDDGPEAKEASVPITAVGKNVHDTCLRAFELIEQAECSDRKGNVSYRPILMPLQLAVRDSCGAKLRGLQP